MLYCDLSVSPLKIHFSIVLPPVKMEELDSQVQDEPTYKTSGESVSAYQMSDDIKTLQTQVRTLQEEVSHLKSIVSRKVEWKDLELVSENAYIIDDSPLKYCKDATGMVSLRGSIHNINSRTSLLCILPEGARPEFEETFNFASNINVSVDGKVTIYDGSQIFSLNGVRFFAKQ